jgi:arginine N-succinyltransferase
MDDAPTLLKLAKMVHFINLPPDREIITEKITNARASFERAAGVNRKQLTPKRHSGSGGISEKTALAELFMFVLDDTENPGCLGTSQIVSQMGGPGNPNVCFKLELREKYSESLKFGTKTTVARIHLDESGPTEIGGLILQPSFRGHPAKLGRFISSVRFHFIGLHRKVFRPTVLAEMMAPITTDGENLIWNAIGRRFIPLSYTEADRFCQYSREFMTALLPIGDIQLSILPPEVRMQFGEVGKETVPARRMLEKLGFKYENFVDPFDGGPYLFAKTDEISIVRDTRRLELGEPVEKADAGGLAIVSILDKDGEFFAVQTPYRIDRSGRVGLPREAFEAINGQVGSVAGFTPIDGSAPPETPAAKKTKSAGKPAKKRSKTEAK